MQSSSHQPHHRTAFTRSTLALLVIIILAFAIRIIGIDWDQGRYLHPDERHIVADVLVGRIELSWPPERSWLDPAESPINPRPMRDNGTYEGFAYGTFPVYTVDILGGIAAELTGVDWNNYAHAEYIGRALSILLDTGTVLLVFLIGTLIAGRTAGLLGAAIYAFLPIAIQTSHFFTVDSWMTFFIFATIYTCMRAVEDTSVWTFALAGVWFGLALASKTTAAPVGAIILLAVVLATLKESPRVPSLRTLLARLVGRGAVAFIAFVAVFAIGAPFALLDPDALLASLREQADIQAGRFDVPFTQQYVGTPRLSYQLVQAIRYTMGPVAVLAGIAGAAGLGWLIVRRTSYAAALLGVWIVGYLAVVLYPETKFPRYTLPIAPALSVCAGIAVTGILLFLLRRHGRMLALAFVAATTLLTTGYGAAFAHVTSAEHTRIASSVWMFENLPPGSTTTNEIWDDQLPMTISPGLSSDARRIDGAAINLYSYTPTLGDIALLGPALSRLPHGNTIAAALMSGDVPKATALLNDITQSEIAAAMQDEHAAQAAARAQDDPSIPAPAPRLAIPQLSSALLAASMDMTTSGPLTQATQHLSQQVATENTITPGGLRDLADVIQTTADQTMLRRIYDLLDEADYYVLASDRVQRGMEHNPWRYAVPIRMYELLDSGTIGYAPMKTFTSYPTLFGHAFPDANADETFLNYDHPVVEVYEKQNLVPYDTFVQRFGSAALAQTIPERNPDTEPLTFDEPVSDLPVVEDFRWSEPLTGSSWGAALMWIFMLVVIQIAAWPLASTVFRFFPDRGWGLTRLLGIIMPATVIWWLSSVGMLQFRSIWAGAAVALFALACWRWFRRGDRSHRRWNFRIIAVAEIIFWATFLLFLVFKMINPDSWHPFWGGEKPMEFAQINAILRSATFPPVDAWYAQGFINYYYYSFYLVAFLIKLTGIPVEYAFNLAQPMVMGVLASGTFSVGAMIGNRITRGRQDGMLSGLIAMALVSFAGNMVDVAHLFERFQGQAGNIAPFLYWVWAPSRAIVDTVGQASGQLITEFPYFTGLYGDLHSHVLGMPLVVLCIALAATFAFAFRPAGGWIGRASLARIAVTIVTLGIIYPTNSWDLPVDAALIAGGIVIGSAAMRTPVRRLITLITSALVVAAGAFVICLPFLWHFEALFGSIDTVPATTSLLELESHVGGLLLVATAAIPGVLLLGRNRRIFMRPLVLVLVLGAVLLARWFLAGRNSELVSWLDYLTVIVTAAIWIGALINTRQERHATDFALPSWTGIVVGIIAALAVIPGLVIDRSVATLWLGIAMSATGFWLIKRPVAARFVALLIAGGAFIGAGVEFVYLVDDLSGSAWARMNTIFKFYNQIWILLGISGGASAGVLIANLFARPGREPQTEDAESALTDAVPGRPARRWGGIATACTALVLVLATAFPVTATGVRLQTRFEPRQGGLTLNAYAWMDYGTVQLTDGTVVTFDEDRDIIDWFNHEVGGTPVIAEASFGTYRCNSSRIANSTGLPAVLGWERHESQQRYSEVLPPRSADLRELYASASIDMKQAIIDRYDIHYIVVGDLERSYPLVSGNDCIPMSDLPRYAEYDLDAGITTFADMVTNGTLEVAYRSGDSVVYRVVANS